MAQAKVLSKQPRKGNQQYEAGRNSPNHVVGAVAAEIKQHSQILTPDTYKVTTTEGIHLVNDEPMTLDSTFADHFLSLDKVPYERPFKDLHTQSLMQEMSQNCMLWEDVVIKTATLKGVTYRINGKHTCLAVKLLHEENKDKGGYLSPVTSVRHLHYEVLSEEALRTLWSKTDAGDPRTQGHQIIALLKGSAGFENFNDETLKTLSEGFGLHFWTANHRRYHRSSHRAHLLKADWKEVAVLVGDFLQEKARTNIMHIYRAPVVAAMFATARVASTGKKGFGAFWTSVRDNIGMSEQTDPRWQYHNYLTKYGIADRGSSRDKPKDTAEKMYRKGIYSWNAWRKSEELKNLRAPEQTKERPKAI